MQTAVHKQVNNKDLLNSAGDCNHHLIVALMKYAAAAAKSLQSCLTLCDSIDGSPPGSLVPGILQARILGWVAIPFSSA